MSIGIAHVSTTSPEPARILRSFEQCSLELGDSEDPSAAIGVIVEEGHGRGALIEIEAIAVPAGKAPATHA